MSQFKRAETSGVRPGMLRENLNVVGLIAFLKNRYPRLTALNVEADTGISARTVECWLERRSRPSFSHGWQLAVTYGPSFLAAVFTSTPAWLREAEKNERLRHLNAQALEIEAERSRLNAA